MPTQVAKTINAGGGADYTTIAAFFAAMPADLVVADQYWTGTITDSSTYAENMSISKTADATRSWKLVAQAGQTPAIAVTANPGFDIFTSYAIVQGIKLQTTTNFITICRLAYNYIDLKSCEVTGGNSGKGLIVSGNNCTVERCLVHDVEVGLDNQGTGDSNTIKNNVFYAIDSRAIDIASGATNTKVYHNTIDVDVAACNGIVVRNTSTPADAISSNIIKVVNGDCLRYLVANTNGCSSDYNRFQVTGTGRVGYVNSTGYTALADWQAATPQDDNSVVGAPGWVDEATQDYDLTATDDGGSGLGVADDYDGNTRADPGDRGAFEYTLADAWTGSGGATSGGSATATMALAATGVGGAVIGGSAAASIVLTWAGAGGAVASGSATVSSTVGAAWKRRGIRDAVASGMRDGAG